MAWLYSFESKEIQKFIMRSDKLREMVGGSELINQLCSEYLPTTIKSLGIDTSQYSNIAKAAGWARVRFNDKTAADRLFKVWPFLVDRFAPGLQVVQSLVEISSGLPDAIREGAKTLRIQRNCAAAQLPEAGPLIERAPRTGLPAVRFDNKVYIDRQSQRKMSLAESDTLIGKMTGADAAKKLWPNDIAKIAKISGSEGSFVAIIHADGNDLGKRLIEIGDFLHNKPDEAAAIYDGFSKAIETATEQAAQKAYRDVLLKDFEEKKRECIAARPIVLGGDDLTIIVRADLAIAFTEIFLVEFEIASQKALLEQFGSFGISKLPKKLTACAGIAFVKQSFPFAAGYELAESLCAYTKKKAKRENEETPASFAFHKVTTSLTGSYEDVIEKELTSGSYSLAFAPYGVGGNSSHLPKYADLKHLVDTLGKFPSGTIRTLISTMYADISKADNEFKRLLQIAGKDKKEALVKALTALTSNKEFPLWKEHQTPLKDAYDLRELMGIKDSKEDLSDAKG